MRKWIAIGVVLFFLGSAAVVSAGLMGFMGADGKPTGCLCSVKAVCLMAKSEADCQKAGGKVVKTCEECKAE